MTAYSALAGAVERGALPDAVFPEPWAARAFALTLALAETGRIGLSEFQGALTAAVAALERQEDNPDGLAYHTAWVEALTTLLGSRGLLHEQRLAVVERAAVAEAASVKAHQHACVRDAEGRPRIAPLVVA